MTMLRIVTAALLAAAIVHPAGHPAFADQQDRSEQGKGRNAKPPVPPVSVERTGDGEPVIVHEGEASFYGGSFHGKKTASGEPFDQNKPTAASRALPLGTKATVTNQENGKSVDVTVNDRGPYVQGRVIDLSKKAARDLGITDDGTAPVRVEAKPSEQPSDQVREKIEAKADSADKTQVADKPAGTPPGNGDTESGEAQFNERQAGASGGDAVTPSESGAESGAGSGE